MLHTGPYETLSEGYSALAESTAALGESLEIGAPMWEEYLSVPETPPEQIQTVIYWPVAKQ